MSEINPFIVNMLSRLKRRNKQLEKLHIINDSGNGQNSLLHEYNNLILKFINSNKDDNNLKMEFFNKDIKQLKEIFKVLKLYQDNLSFYQDLNIESYKKFILQSNILRQQEFIGLSSSSIKQIKSNNEYFADSSFYQINQTLKSLENFMFYLQHELRHKLEKQTSLFSILIKILLAPLELWSVKGLELIKNRYQSKKTLLQDLKQLNLMSINAINLSTYSFQLRLKTSNISEELSLREKDSIKELLNDKLVQKQLLRDGVITSIDIKTLETSWFNVFIKINKEGISRLINLEEVSNSITTFKQDSVCLKGDHQQRLIKFLHICQAIYQSEVAKHSFGLRYSIIEGILKYGSSKVFRRRLTRLKKLQPYIDAVETIKNELELFFPYIKKHKIEGHEDYMLLELIDNLVSCTQNNEAKLSISDIGYQLLDILKHLNYQLRHYQASSNKLILNLTPRTLKSAQHIDSPSKL